ncbi:hypothetical protein [Streptomyces aidingensis]|uniref:Uncharacterized protein n=1 Tax=Streptomyces aidingensis TaxID=910347 RepID=A0A1I1NZU4_9ACTN|nr:hypothetical protein [Streptomyces aidingensis]SFC99220.1 hypothetical protein SAMN05421773_10896 [Streptomyces aidingensis]
MKTTIPMRMLANPRRTTLVHLESADELRPSVAAGGRPEAELPSNTANPARTVLVEAPRTNGVMTR